MKDTILSNVPFNFAYISLNLSLPEVRNSGREVTPNLPDRIGMNADVVAANAARLRAAADAAALRVGYASAAPGSDRNERQSVYTSTRPTRAHVIVELELRGEDRARTGGAHGRRGPSPFYMVQYLAQESATTHGDVPIQSRAATHYPSLEFDQDIYLPGSPDMVAADGPRVDILV